jgi:hypothetical protein
VVDEDSDDEQAVKAAHCPLQAVNSGFDSGEAVSNGRSVFEALFKAQDFFVYLFRSHFLFGLPPGWWLPRRERPRTPRGNANQTSVIVD